MGKWILAWLLSPVGRQYIEKVASSTTGLYTLSIRKVGNLPIALPPLIEQSEITPEIERRLAAADKLAAKLEQQLDQARSTHQSLLREAFTGHLVQQNLDDEPASALLDRIRALRGSPARVSRIKQQPRVLPIAKNLETRKQLRLNEGTVHKKVISPIPISTRTTFCQVRLLRLKLHEDFNSLKASNLPLRTVGRPRERLSPICLVGLNGSGKSNLIEALSEIYCHAELSLLPWGSITKDQRAIDFRFELEYQLMTVNSNKPTIVRLEKPDHRPVTFKRIQGNNEEIVTAASECLALLPTRILGYSSGLNETISIPYFRTAAIYSQEVLKQARREKAQPDVDLPDVPDSRTFFMDYECNSLILVSNYMLQPRSRLTLLRETLRIDSLSSFDICYRSTYQGTKPVELTKELTGYLDAIRDCADSIERSDEKDTQIFRFTNPKVSAQRLQAAFSSASSFFRALYKLSLLNPLALTGKKRKFFLREDARVGQLERPPTISREDRIFSVEHIRVNLTNPKRAIDYAGVSDGEHQFLQIFGSIILFDEPGCVFLLDEPETHFNPQWRRLFIQWIAKFKATMRQEVMISTHSPFVVSGCKGKHVFKFTRDGDGSVCLPVGFETFGASYDFLLTRLFNLETLISSEAIEEMRAVVKSSSIDTLQNAIPQFGESLEKRFIFERIAQLERKKKQKK